jgi:hypothetical protein
MMSRKSLALGLACGVVAAIATATPAYAAGRAEDPA